MLFRSSFPWQSSTEGSGKEISPIFHDCFTFEDGTDKLFQKVGKKLKINGTNNPEDRNFRSTH